MQETFTVTDIVSTERNTRRGPALAFDLKTNNNEKIQCGFINPATKGIHSGDTITAEVDRTGQWGPKIDLKTYQPGAAGSAPRPLTPANPNRRQEKVFPVPTDHGDMSIIRQNAVARAVEIFQYKGLWSKGKAGDEMEQEVEHMLFIADLITAWTSGQREMSGVPDEDAPTPELDSIAKKQAAA
jgi:hypothetical protein